MQGEVKGFMDAESGFCFGDAGVTAFEGQDNSEQ